MTFVFKADPDQSVTDSAVAASMVPRDDLAREPFIASSLHGFGDAFRAALVRENTVSSTIHALSGGPDQTPDPSHNPFRWLQETYDKETLDKLAPYIDDGEFDASPNAAVSQDIADELLYEIDLQEKMGASLLGSLAGSGLAALLDPTSYIPLGGQLYRGGRLGRMGLAAVHAALTASVSESILQATQRSRTLEETIMNIGTAGLLGGGLGIFSGAVAKDHPLHPKNENNPLRRENLDRQGEVYTTAGSIKKDNVTAEELDDLRESVGTSVGAAKVGRTIEDVDLARGDPKTIIGRFLRRTGDDYFNSVMPTGRIVRGISPLAQTIGVRLGDIGGILLKSYLRGEAATRSAEILKADFMLEAEQLYAAMISHTAKLNKDLGKSPLSRVIPGSGVVKHDDVMKLTQRKLYGMEELDHDLVKGLNDKYGEEAYKMLDQVAEKNAEQIHKLNAVWEDRLLKEGILQNPKVISDLQSKYEGLKSQVEALKESGDEAELSRVRKQRDDTRDALRAEERKAKPLGRDYGHAQMWNKDAIIQNPDDFRGFLLEVLSVRPDDEWLSLQYDGMTLGELDALRLTDKAKFREIMDAWAGDEYYVRIEKLERDLKAAKENSKQSNLDLQESLRAAGEMKRDEVGLTISQARAKTKNVVTQRDLKRKQVDELTREQRAFREAATAARSSELDRLKAEGPNAAQRSQERVSEHPKTLDTAIEDNLTPKKRQRAKNADAKARNDKSHISEATARQEGRAQQVADDLARAKKELDVLEARAQRVEEKLNEIERLKDEMTMMRKQLDDEVAAARKERKITDKELSKVKRALLKGRKETPLDQMVKDITSNLTTTGAVPQGIMDRIAASSDRTTGRVKDRILNLDKDQRIEAIQKGYLRDDLNRILYSQYNQLSAELAVREGVGIGPNRQFSSWSEVRTLLDEEYNSLQAEASGNPKLLARIQKERKNMFEDLELMRSRLKGQFDDDNEWAKWISEKFRHMNYIRYGGGFLLSSATDVGTFGLRHGNFLKALMTTGPKAIKIMKNAYSDNPTDFNTMVFGMEYGTGAAAAARRFGQDDLLQDITHGIGTGTTKKVTAKIDRGLERASEFVTTWSGLPLWNRFWKVTSGIMMSEKLGTNLSKYDTLSHAERTDLASLGIGKAEAKRLAGFLEKYAKRDENGIMDPHMEKWGDSDSAIEAARDFRIAIQRDMRRSINTPGVGDTPRLMSKWWGATLLQFQTFAFTFMNQTAYPLVQRASLFKERQAFMAMGTIMAAAAFVLFGKDIQNGRDPMERLKEENLQKTLHEIIDRSGFLGYTSPFVDSALKLTSPITGYGGTNRYARNNALDSLMGVNMSLLSDIGRAGGALTSGDPKVIDKFLALAPFSSQARLFWNLGND